MASSPPAKPEHTPPGALLVSDLPVSTGDIDLYIWAGTTLSIPTPHPTPAAHTISYLALPYTILPNSDLALPSLTLSPNAPAASIPGGDDWLPQSASYGAGKLILGVKTSTDTYPPVALETASGLGAPTVTGAPATPTGGGQGKAAVSTSTSITMESGTSTTTAEGMTWTPLDQLLPPLTEAPRSTGVASTMTMVRVGSSHGPFWSANGTVAVGSGTPTGSGIGGGGATGPVIVTGGAGRVEMQDHLLGIATVVGLALKSFW